ncbi:MAG: hypothetical protein NTZ87_03740 [Candidatus Nomurabacteria bacterium]|nr:hypothetical protein [Candidatus Nomurabacteria bacterium]
MIDGRQNNIPRREVAEGLKDLFDGAEKGVASSLLPNERGGADLELQEMRERLGEIFVDFCKPKPEYILKTLKGIIQARYPGAQVGEIYRNGGADKLFFTKNKEDNPLNYILVQEKGSLLLFPKPGDSEKFFEREPKGFGVFDYELDSNSFIKKSENEKPGSEITPGNVTLCIPAVLERGTHRYEVVQKGKLSNEPQPVKRKPVVETPLPPSKAPNPEPAKKEKDPTPLPQQAETIKTAKEPEKVPPLKQTVEPSVPETPPLATPPEDNTQVREDPKSLEIDQEFDDKGGKSLIRVFRDGTMKTYDKKTGRVIEYKGKNGEDLPFDASKQELTVRIELPPKPPKAQTQEIKLPTIKLEDEPVPPPLPLSPKELKEKYKKPGWLKRNWLRLGLATVLGIGSGITAKKAGEYLGEKSVHAPTRKVVEKHVDKNTKNVARKTYVSKVGNISEAAGLMTNTVKAPEPAQKATTVEKNTAPNNHDSALSASDVAIYKEYVSKVKAVNTAEQNFIDYVKANPNKKDSTYNELLNVAKKAKQDEKKFSTDTNYVAMRRYENGESIPTPSDSDLSADEIATYKEFMKKIKIEGLANQNFFDYARTNSGQGETYSKLLKEQLKTQQDKENFATENKTAIDHYLHIQGGTTAETNTVSAPKTLTPDEIRAEIEKKMQAEFEKKLAEKEAAFSNKLAKAEVEAKQQAEIREKIEEQLKQATNAPKVEKDWERKARIEKITDQREKAKKDGKSNSWIEEHYPYKEGDRSWWNRH